MTQDTGQAAAGLAATMAQFDDAAAAHQRLATTALAHNKQALFTAMRAAGVTEIVVTFDGYGDSGQIEEIEVRSGLAAVELPKVDLEIAGAPWGVDRINLTQMALEQAVEAMAYDLLSEAHGGWENNDCAYGEFHFDTEAETILLDFNERYTSSEYYNHSF